MSPDGWFNKQMLLGIECVTTAVAGAAFVWMHQNRLRQPGMGLLGASVPDADRDRLSGVMNQQGIVIRLALELAQSDRSGQRLSVALMDIDHFKRINDAHGREAGDDVIRGVAEAMARQLRASDALGRYDGDVFLVVLPMTMASDAVVVAERLNEAVSGMETHVESRGLTLSIGISEASPDDDAAALIARVDRALLQAKGAGRNCMRAVLPERTFADEVGDEPEAKRLRLRVG